MPLVCKGGLMYLQLQGIPTDQDLQNYPSVHLTSPHEWDPSVLDYEQKAQYDKHKKVINAPPGYQKIGVHLIFAVKYDGRHKARLVADGHLTPEPVESIYSGVVSLRNLKLVIFLGKLNNLELWGVGGNGRSTC